MAEPKRQTKASKEIDRQAAIRERKQQMQRLAELSAHKPAKTHLARPFSIAKPPPGVVPDGELVLAMDDASAISNWAQSGYLSAFSEGMEFLGYPYLAEMSQRGEYRTVVEVIATEATRKWIKFKTKGDGDKTDKIAEIENRLDQLRARDAFRRVAEQDGFFGRSHLFLDFGDRREAGADSELAKPIGNGRNDLSKGKASQKKPLLKLKPVEPVWTYPTSYNSFDPLSDDWYKPSEWFVMGRRVHATRLLPFVAREVPDLLKPAYSFGGLAMTQIAKPAVDNWLSIRQGVTDIVNSFTVFCLITDMSMSNQMGGAETLDARITAFNNYRNSRGLMVLDKLAEDFKNVSTSLATLDILQAQAQEHIASVSKIPIIKLLGVSPAGLNATGEGDIRNFYDSIGAYQESFFRPHLTTVIDFVQLSLFGEVDEEINFEFEPLWSLDEKQQAEVDKIKAETAQIRIDSGVTAPEEERAATIDDPDSPHAGLNPDDAPDLKTEEEAGLVIKGGSKGEDGSGG